MDTNYTEEQELMQELAEKKVTELYKLQFLSHTGEPTSFFLTHNLEEQVVQLDDIGKGYEEMIIRLGWKAMDNESKKPMKKYARVARVFLPALRKIFYKGFAKREAQLLMEEMMLQSTVPFNDLDGGFGGNNYTNLDSYTGQPLEQITLEQERMDLGNRVAPIVPQISDGLTARIIEVNGDLMVQASNASRENYDVSEEVWYEDRDREDGPIQQENDLMLHLNIGEVYSLIRTFRRMWFKKNRRGERVIFWWLKNAAPKNYRPQNLLAVILAFQLDNMLSQIPCHFPPGSSLRDVKNMQQFYELFGDDILDEFVDMYDDVTDNEGSAKEFLTEDEIFDIARGFEDAIVATFNGDSIPHTRVFCLWRVQCHSHW